MNASATLNHRIAGVIPAASRLSSEIGFNAGGFRQIAKPRVGRTKDHVL